MNYKKCACCSKETLEEGSTHDICPVCGWEDDNVQNNDPDYEGGANFISLHEAQQVLEDGKDLRLYKRAAKKRYWDHQRQQEAMTASREPVLS